MALAHKWNSLQEGLDAYTPWFQQNIETITDPIQCLKFLKEAADKELDLIHLLVDDFNALRNKTPKSHLLWTPERDHGQWDIS